MLQLARTANSELHLNVRDAEVRRLADRHAGWCWDRLSHFVAYRHDPECQAWRGRLSGMARRGRVRLRDRLVAAFLADHPGTTFTAVARAVGMSRTQVMRVMRRGAPELHQSIRSRFISAARRAGRAAPERWWTPSRPTQQNNQTVSAPRRRGQRQRWRRRRDSNPRDGFPPTPLAGERLRPLGHVSADRSSVIHQHGASR